MKIDPTLPEWQRDKLKAVRRKTFAKCNFMEQLRPAIKGSVVSMATHVGCTYPFAHVHMAERQMHLPDTYIRPKTKPIPSGWWLHESFHIYDATTLTYEKRCEFFRLFFGHDPTGVDEYWGLRMPKSETRWWFGGTPSRGTAPYLERGGELFAYFAVYVTMDKDFRGNKTGAGLMTPERLAAFSSILGG